MINVSTAIGRGVVDRVSADNPYFMKSGRPRPSEYYHTAPDEPALTSGCAAPTIFSNVEAALAPRTCIGCGELLLPDQVVYTELEPGQYVLHVGEDQVARVYKREYTGEGREYPNRPGFIQTEIEVRTKWPVK